MGGELLVCGAGVAGARLSLVREEGAGGGDLVWLEGVQTMVPGTRGVSSRTFQLGEELRHVGIDGGEGGGGGAGFRVVGARLRTRKCGTAVVGAQMWRRPLLDSHRLGHTDLH